MSAAIDQSLQFEFAEANGMTPLMHAVCDDSFAVVQALLDCGADVNAKRNDGFTALALAAFFGRTRIVELLLERGADVRVVTRFGTSPEMWAKARGVQEIVDLLQNVSGIEITSDECVSAGAPVTPSRTLPEIHDPPPLSAPAFHPGQAFITRITSDRKSLAALTVALIVTLGLGVFATYQIRNLLKDDVKQTASTDNGLVKEPQAAVGQPVEPQSEPQESGRDQEFVSNQGATGDLPDKAASGPSEKSVPPAVMVKPGIKTLSTPRLSHSSFPTVRRHTVTRSEQPKQEAEPENESKPAPLTVEVSRDSNSSPAPATHSADPPPPQSAPLGITSSKRRTKVIQWP